MISVDLDANVAIINGRMIRLEAKKAEMLYVLKSEPNPIRPNRLKAALWGATQADNRSDNVLHQHVSQLRKKLRPFNIMVVGSPRGYRLVEPVRAATQ